MIADDLYAQGFQMVILLCYFVLGYEVTVPYDLPVYDVALTPL